MRSRTLAKVRVSSTVDGMGYLTDNCASVSTYFAYPESKQTENAILILTDVIGHKFINAQL